MPFGDFKNTVAAFLNRAPSALVRNTVDLVLVATNRAKLWAQRSHDFELARARTTLTINGVTGGAISTVVGFSVKRVERVYTTTGVWVDFVDRETATSRFLRRVSIGGITDEIARVTAGLGGDPKLPLTTYQLGGTIYMMFPLPPLFLSPTDNVVFNLDIVQWMPDYAVDADDDFFLQFGNDFMLYRTLTELNVYLKEDERVKINQDKMGEAWQAFLDWDDRLVPNNPITAIQKPAA